MKHINSSHISPFFLFVYSVCISAVILSSEALNSEPTTPDLPDNVVHQPTIASDNNVISDKISDSLTVTDRTNQNSDAISTSDNSEQEKKLDTFLPKIETQLPQPDGLESIQNLVIPEQQIPPEKTTEDNV